MNGLWADLGVPELAEAGFIAGGGVCCGGLHSSLSEAVDVLAGDGLAEGGLGGAEAEARGHDVLEDECSWWWTGLSVWYGVVCCVRWWLNKQCCCCCYRRK